MFWSADITNFWFGVLVLLIGAMPVAANSSEATDAALIRAQTLNSQGARQLETGQATTALESWRQAEASYTAAGDETGILGSQLNQVQALQALGQYRRAKSLLDQISAELSPLPDSLLKADSLTSLGIALFYLGDLQESDRVLQSSLQISQRLSGDTSNTLLALGNVVRSRSQELNSIALPNTERSPLSTSCRCCA
ncbi:MAG: tetratricopeptide repeat protein [Leptolyngbyaceae cyanobacterium SM1_4_3]|nr:tetratricopeptide repeat protein [Leptolyngbyaceae cyanobacterium SM1_4_3]